MSENEQKFVPIKVPPAVQSSGSRGYPLTISTIVHGDIAKKFEKMVEENNLTRSSLLRQMTYFCLGCDNELEAIKRQVLLWGYGDETTKKS